MVYGRVLDEYYSNENASMEWGTGPDYWDLNSLTTGDGKTNERAKKGQYSFKINGTTANKYFGQYAEVQGKAGDPLVISGWAYPTGTNVSGGEFGLRLWFMYTDGTSKLFTIPYDKAITDQWQFVKKTLRAEKEFNRVKIYGTYFNQTGSVYFDNLKVEEGSATITKSYTLYGNEVQLETDELNNITTNDYDGNGNLKYQRDASGKETEFTYNPLNLIHKAILKAASAVEDIVVEYLYDDQGNLIDRIDPRGKVTKFEYNSINKLTKEIDPLGKFTRNEYDNNGNITLIEKGKDSNIASKEEFIYDRKNRLSEKSVDGVTLYTNSYDHADNKTAITLPDGNQYSFTYDENSRLLTVQEPGGYKLTNSYDNSADGDGNGMRLKYSEIVGGATEETFFKYDILKRVMAVTGPKGGKTEYFYDEKGNRSRIKSGSSNIYQDFDDADRLVKQTVRYGSDRSDLAYSYYANDQLKTYTADGKTQSFTYDFAKRLTSWINNGVTTNYSYDKAGNLINSQGQNLTFNDANEIIGFDYDNAGNLVKDNKYIYTWDQEGRLTSTKDLNNNIIASYTYHPDGLRKTKTVGTVTYNYHYDGTDLIRITDNNGTLWTFTWDGGKPISVTNQNGWNYYYITNFRGDVVRIVNESGTTVASYEYDPWGKVLNSWESSSVQGQPLRYAGYYYDTDTKLYYLQARYYDAETARFISRDPDGGDKNNPLSQNLYAYGNGDPVNNVDPDGEWAFLARIAINAAIYAYTTPRSQWSAWGFISNSVGFGKLFKGAKIAKFAVRTSKYKSKTRQKKQIKLRSSDAKKREAKQIKDKFGSRSKRERATRELHRDKISEPNYRNREWRDLDQYLD